jgi:SOS-response transcriptional repressor LexA
MLTWEERIERVKEACAIKNNRQLEERLGLANGYINDLLKGKNKNPGKLTAAFMKELLINPMWLEDETCDMFGKVDFERLIPPKPPLLQDLEKYIKEVVSDDLAQIQIRLKAVENTLGIYQAGAKSLQDPSGGGGFTGETEPEYEAEEQVRIPYVETIAAGPPIAQSEDQTGLVPAPARLVKAGFRYYAASIRGESMAEAGIRDGDLALVRRADTPRDGAIQVVRYQGKSTLKRLREVEGKGWELHYEDGSGRFIPANSGDYEVQGEFVAILPHNTVPEGSKKDR